MESSRIEHYARQGAKMTRRFNLDETDVDTGYLVRNFQRWLRGLNPQFFEVPEWVEVLPCGCVKKDSKSSPLVVACFPDGRIIHPPCGEELNKGISHPDGWEQWEKRGN